MGYVEELEHLDLENTKRSGEAGYSIGFEQLVHFVLLLVSNVHKKSSVWRLFEKIQSDGQHPKSFEISDTAQIDLSGSRGAKRER